MNEPAPTSSLVDVLFDGGDRDAAGDQVELTADRRLALIAIMSDPDQSALNIGDACSQYTRGLPRRAVSRDPHTGNLVTLALDTWGLDGPFWDREGPVRPVQERPWTLTAMTGAIQLDGGAEWTDHVVMPGPDRPFVLPRLLQGSGRAVISQLRIGMHPAWLILYFHLDPWDLGPRYNAWGDMWHHYPDGHGEVQRVHVDERREPIDLDVGRWMDVGRLLWLDPGDPSLTLQEGWEGCPFLDVEGHGRLQVVQHGRVATFPTMHVLPAG